MADQLATSADLTTLLGPGVVVDPARATLLIECATAVVQAAAGGQRIVQVVGDVAELVVGADAWLELPQQPVTAVTSAAIDGGTALTVGTGYKVFGGWLWRSTGWAAVSYEPSSVSVVYTHGYPPGHQALQLARSAVLGLIRDVAALPGAAGIKSESIDDYAVTYAAMSASMDASSPLKTALHKQYGRRAGLVKIGG